MNSNTAFLELKYGNIYGGFPNFYAISEIAFLVFENSSNKIFLESWVSNANVEIVNVYPQINELGHTVGRGKEVINLRTRRRKPFKEDFRLEEEDLQNSFKNLRPTKMPIKSFLGKAMKKYQFKDIIVFDGRRDVFLCEKSGANFSRANIIDIQKDLNKETDYLFSLNKLSVVVNFELDRNYLRSNNQEYWLHPIAAKQITPKSAAYDAARLMMVYNEYTKHHGDFLIHAQKLLNKIQTDKM